MNFWKYFCLAGAEAQTTIRLRGGGGWRMLPGMDCGRTYLTVLAWLLRVGLGSWFVWSGSHKVFVSGLSRFTQDVANYQLVTAPLDAVAAYTVPWVEMVAGICLLLGLLRQGTLLVLGGLVTVFAVAIAWAWSKQLDIACGCHGGDAPIRYWSKVLEFAAYYAAFAGLWWLENSRPGGVRWTRSHCGGSAETTGC